MSIGTNSGVYSVIGVRCNTLRRLNVRPADPRTKDGPIDSDLDWRTMINSSTSRTKNDRGKVILAERPSFWVMVRQNVNLSIWTISESASTLPSRGPQWCRPRHSNEGQSVLHAEA
ncbi:hypothetical protein M378DRAFT_154762 [Amanita muscaria Koide BX008]|uniref:Uncharacterized protein n=1 Tax=Amanita muscaria (strain Koide BX008) TaxID=946122 RepID=A0A0C2XNR8_AMAMK|nr:hypothetical protein M378DRAFT_154762 [Amanita muscaria Koide BX008]